MSKRINLNADLGESFGAWTMGDDAAMLQLVNSANVACGFHAGDPLVMQATVATAKRCGVSLGAHPGFPDRQGFGRRRMDIPANELQAMLIYQIGALSALARADGMVVSHVKPHGALNNLACVNREVAASIAGAIHRLDPGLILLAPALSELAAAGRSAGLQVVEEIFADRAYLDDGSLVPRAQPGALIHGAEACLRHVRAMLDAGGLLSINGKTLPVAAQSICVHGDNPEAVATARAIRDGLQAAGYELVALPALAASGSL
ncbi:MAG TPA: 5-oxoprolinase subunit PxpA [Rhodocyclaceae bacterium]|nr:5-oxoprolinase subunit PxpA [Rhodocyclaceae bacterium]